MLKWIFLGTNGSLQDTESGNTSLLIEGTEGKVVVDLSGNLPTAVDADVDEVILTHEHIDHVYGLPSFLHQLWLQHRARPLCIRVPAGMESLTEQWMEQFRIRSKPEIYPISVVATDVFTVGSMHFTLFKTDHSEMSVGIAVEEHGQKLVYTCDTRPFQIILDCFIGADVLIHEASGVSAEKACLLKKGHSAGSDAAALAERLGVKRLYLCHLPKGKAEKDAVLADAQVLYPGAELPKVLYPYTV